MRLSARWLEAVAVAAAPRLLAWCLLLGNEVDWARRAMPQRPRVMTGDGLQRCVDQSGRIGAVEAEASGLAGDSPPGGGDRQVDYFISHADPDREWAEWVAATLLDARYSIELGVWDWAAGTNLIEAMNSALRRAKRMIALASPDYFARTWTSAELHAAFVRQAQQKTLLIPVLIRPCADEYPPVLESLIRIELAGLDETTARARLLEGLAGSRRPPVGTTVPFPGLAPAAPVRWIGPPVVFPGQLPPVWGRVPARNLFFTGRERLLADLHSRLTSGPGRVAVTALHGSGGFGKTQLAVEYAWRHAAELDAVWWIDAETSTTLTAGLADLARTLGVGAGTGPERAAAALAELGRRENWLLIYDNAADPVTLADLFPPPPGRLIVTTRDEGLRRVVGDLLGISEFTRDESIQLLRRHISDLSKADQLAETLGDLPLAIDQAGAFLAATGMDISTYLTLLADQPIELLNERTPHHQSIARTVSAAYNRLATGNSFAAALLDQLSFLAPEPIPLAATPSTDVVPVQGALVVADPLTTHVALAAISRYALARRTGTTLQLHRLVHTLLRAQLNGTDAQAALEGALSLVGTAKPGEPENPADWPAYAALTPHITAAAAHLPATGEVPEPDEFRRLLDRTCWYLRMSGQPDAAHALADATRTRWITGLTPEHPDTQTVTVTLAAALADLGQSQAARELDEDTLARRRQTLGNDHPDTLTSASNLAARLIDLGELPAAHNLIDDTLARRRRQLGDDHRDTMGLASNLATVLARLGDLLAARELAEDTLTRQHRSLGDDHPDTLGTASTLATLLARLGDLPSARDLAEDTLTRQRRSLGDNHPDTLGTAHNLAIHLAGLGDLQAARELVEDTVTRRRRQVGDDHPDTRHSERFLEWIATRERLAPP